MDAIVLTDCQTLVNGRLSLPNEPLISTTHGRLSLPNEPIISTTHGRLSLLNKPLISTTHGRLSLPNEPLISTTHGRFRQMNHKYLLHTAEHIHKVQVYLTSCCLEDNQLRESL